MRKTRMTKSILLLITIWCAVFIVLWHAYGPPINSLIYYAKYYRPFNKQRKIVLVHNGNYGEQDVIAKIIKVCKQKKIKTLNFNLNACNNCAYNMPPTDKEQVKTIIPIFKPDFVFIFEEDIADKFKGAPNYMSLNRGGIDRFVTLSENGEYVLRSPNLSRFDALLTAFEDTNLLDLAITNVAKQYFDIRFHMSAYSTDYAPAYPKKLFYAGGILWDDTRSSTKYLEVFKKLNNKGYFVVCGRKERWQFIEESAIGELPFDGESVIKNIHAAGVVLILHDATHFAGSAPTSRIFEAIAANAIIISDKHPFITKYFGDNVLYIDTNTDAESMFKQIDDHMHWILNNPATAQSMAQKCNDIFKKKFLLEDQIDELFAFTERYKNYKKFIDDIKPVSALGNKASKKIKIFLAENNLPSFWAIIHVQNNNIHYYFNKEPAPGTSIPWLNKLYTVAKQLECIKQSKETLPDGSYIISLQDGIHSKPPIPVLAFASDKELVMAQKVVLLPDNDAQNDYTNLFNSLDAKKDQYKWEQKTAQIFWRGQTTGLDFQNDKSTFPRLEFIQQFKHKPYIDAAFTHITRDLNSELRAKILHDFPLKAFIKPDQALQYKYLLDIDGHSCSYSRMAWSLYSQSLLFKHQSNKVQWYYHKLTPYVHYLPVNHDFSNLHEQYLWAQSHPREAKNIANNAQQIAAEIFNPNAISKATHEAFIKYNLLVE